MSSFEDLRFASNSCKILQLVPKGGYTDIIFSTAANMAKTANLHILCKRRETSGQCPSVVC